MCIWHTTVRARAMLWCECAGGLHGVHQSVECRVFVWVRMVFVCEICVQVYDDDDADDDDDDDDDDGGDADDDDAADDKDDND